MIRLHHAPMSRSSRFIWLAEELGAEIEVVYTDVVRMDGSGARDPGNPHPEGKVPVLDHDGVIVTESAAIALYLTDLFPEAGVGPQPGDADRGPYLSWLAWYAGVLEPVLNLHAAGVGDNPILVRTFRDLAAVGERIEGALKQGPYLLGERFSAADILLASAAQFNREALPSGDPVDAYLQRVNERPALARAFARDAPPA